MVRVSGANAKAKRYKKRFISRRPKTREIEIVSRRGQPQVTVQVPALKRQELEMASVASSWISHLSYDKGLGYATMVLIDGHIYTIKMPFKVFEEWFHAHSKGTFFNRRVRTQFTVRRLR